MTEQIKKLFVKKKLLFLLRESTKHVAYCFLFGKLASSDKMSSLMILQVNRTSEYT